jgi:RNA polymerase sigma-70 factor (ECF subfamily)
MRMLDTSQATSAPPPPDDDASLAAALQARTPRATDVAWRRLSPMVLSVLRRNVDAVYDRQDLCQEVFLRFFARIHELRNPAALRGFMLAICLGVAQNELRRAKKRRWLLLTATGTPPETATGPANPEARVVVTRFFRAIAGVSADDRALFITRYVEKMAMPEIAAATDLSLSTAKRHLKRATRRVVARMRRDPSLASYADELVAARALRGRGGSQRSDRARVVAVRGLVD